MINPECLDVLLRYRQADEDGVMVLVSRQAIHETLDHIAEIKSGMPRWVAVSERLPDIGNKIEWVRKSDNERVFFALNQFQIDEGKTHLVFAYWLDNVPPAPAENNDE